MQSDAESVKTLGWALFGLQLLMGFSAVGMGVYLYEQAQAGRRAGQWPPPGTRLLRWREPVTGDRARRIAIGMMVAAAALAAAGGYLVSLAFRFVRLFGLW